MSGKPVATAIDRAATADDSRRYEIAVAAAIAGLILVRLICAAVTPLAFDEAFYWRWSKHLAGGYLDHPPMIAWLIRIGTSTFGDTQFGVRIIGVLLGLPASWAVWRAAAILFGNGKLGATAALFFNLTLVMAVGSLLATPDSPLVVAACFLLLSLAKVIETGRSIWWLAVGAAFGAGMLSKYTMALFAAGILAWVALVPELRKWLFNPWPWAGALLALAIFSPVLVWNAQHEWVSFLFVLRRVVVEEWSLRYLGELVGTQFGLATPSIFVLGCMGLVGLLRQKGEPYAARALIGAMVGPVMIYFVWHSFHARVEGNWPEPAYPAFCLAAAAAAQRLHWEGGAAWLAQLARRLAVPVGLGLAAMLYLQAIFGIVPLGGLDPSARQLGVGWAKLGTEIDEIRKQAGAPVILTADYGLSGWLAFYVPSHPPVEQIKGPLWGHITTRTRWINEPAPAPAIFGGPMLFVCWNTCLEDQELRSRFKIVELIATLPRTRRGVVIDYFPVYRVAEPLRPVLE